MDDDFNTPEAIAVLQNITREINSAKAAGQQAQAAALGAELRSLGAVLGLVQVDPQLWVRLSSTTSMAGRSGASHSGDAPFAAALTDADIDGRIAARLAARKAKNWPESDRIRDELAKAGVILEDKPGGTTSWRRS
jgi:cysteinyl-tRNA synthetase